VTIVSNTSPLTNLAAIDRLNLLHQLYGEISIPEEVFKELIAISSPEAKTEFPLHKDRWKALPWLKIQNATNQHLVNSLLIELDKGEAEAITLAIELEAEFALIDERRGRKAASRLGVKTVGLLGVLIEAKYRNLIPAVRPLLQDLEVRAGFWVGQELHRRVLREAGEYD